MTQEQLNEVLKKHESWLNNEEGGERANLIGTDLIGADLSCKNLSCANLIDVNLSGSDLRYTCLRDVNLSGSDLRGSNLIGSDLRGSNLSDSNLNGANLIDADLSDANLVVFQLPLWSVYIHAGTVRIGCKNYTHDDWLSFDDDTISKMHENALEWWKEHKQLITAGIEVVKAQVEKKKLAVA